MTEKPDIIVIPFPDTEGECTVYLCYKQLAEDYVVIPSVDVEDECMVNGSW